MKTIAQDKTLVGKVAIICCQNNYWTYDEERGEESNLLDAVVVYSVSFNCSFMFTTGSYFNFQY